MRLQNQQEKNLQAENQILKEALLRNQDWLNEAFSEKAN